MIKAHLTAAGCNTRLPHADVDITYRSSRGSDLDTRLLRANVIKGILEEITTANVNMVNADLLAEQRGLRITETISKTDSKAIVSDMNVKIGTNQSKFSGAVVGDKISVSVRISSSFGDVLVNNCFFFGTAAWYDRLMIPEQDKGQQ